ncbi:hypothetical protein Tco_0100592 [Tanacetum coccineum]
METKGTKSAKFQTLKYKKGGELPFGQKFQKSVKVKQSLSLSRNSPPRTKTSSRRFRGFLAKNTMAEQNVPTQPPTRTDEQIVPRTKDSKEPHLSDISGHPE